MGNSENEKSQASTIKILTKLLLLLILMGLLGSCWLFINWLNKPGNFPFKKVELINQLENQESKELQNVTASALNGGFFSLNVDELRADLLVKLPWVKSVSIRKVWPNKLVVKIIEHKPVARWLSVENNDSKHIQLVSRNGVVFNPELTEKQKFKFSQMALLTGTSSNAEKILTNCVQLNKKLKRIEFAIKQCGMNERRSWKLKLSHNNDLDIKLGKEKIMQQLERFILVFSGQLKQYLSSVESADLRYANGFSVKWKSVSTLTNTIESSSQHSLQNKVLINKSREQE